MKKALLISGSILFYVLWVKIIIFLSIPAESDYPMLRARLGTILHHSSDNLGEAHTYCYYPKAEAESKVIIKKQSSDDCSSWYGQVVFYEGRHVSEREKYWWSKEQHIQDCAGCSDLKFIAEKP